MFEHAVWAAGDVAHYPEPCTGRRLRIEHWRIAQQQGKAAVLSMAGRGEPFRGVPFFWTQQYRLAIGCVGAAVLRARPDVDLLELLAAE